MPSRHDKIRQVLRDFTLDTEQHEKILEKVIPADNSYDKAKDDLNKHLKSLAINTESVQHEALNKMMALSFFAAGEEAKGINHLVQAHAVIHRQQINFRHIKSKIRDQVFASSTNYGINPEYVEFDVDCIDGPNSLKAKLSELPNEWYMIQVTIQYEPPKVCQPPATTHPMHVVILPTGENSFEPFCITIPKPPTNMFDICKEITDLLHKNKTDLRGKYTNHNIYWKMRAKQNTTMESAVKEMENNWLREWRILFIADPLVPSDLIKSLHDMIDKLIADDSTHERVSPKVRWLLKKITTCSYCLSKTEIKRAINYILADNQKLAKNIILSIHGRQKEITKLRNEKRKTLVLVIDEHMDYLPFEAMSLLKKQPVTRFSCVHLAYAMFKEHEDTIEEGCKVVDYRKELCTFIVNPENNLPRMEARLKLFLKYWLSDWKGLYNRRPDQGEFSAALTDHNVLMYNGHGNGVQFFSGEEIERLRVNSTVLLFGCSSVRLVPVGGRFPPYGVSNQYLTASSPCILGMLWEVTDGDTDKMTASFISNWIPSTAPRPWSHVDTERWNNGELKFKGVVQTCESEQLQEPELLRAFAKAKEVCSQYMTSAAAVVRGLPIKLKY
ncbi:separin [Microplitis mediator]|uniref:separin n=1 Tax=Microplitis mediator TaxID=375433 RepID=UPI002552B19C|nr:separin [Microplitis mediator]